MNSDSLAEALHQLALLAPGESLRVEEAGDGNINWVRRVRLGDGRSFVVKHAGAALERFPEYRADPIRLRFEVAYMDAARPCDRDCILPRVLGFDPALPLLVLEDLGAAPRMDAALLRGDLLDARLAAVAAFLARVHAATASDPTLAARFHNDQMRRLHGDHIFHLPFRPNDFPLPAPVRRAAETLWNNSEVRGRADAAYARYLEPRGALVHADVQGSNILLAGATAKLLDAEIAHVGDPAFDIGTLLAHVWLPAIARGAAEEAAHTSRHLWETYRDNSGGAAPFADVARYAAIEMLRRTIGAARVAAVASAETSLAVIARAAQWLRSPPNQTDRL